MDNFSFRFETHDVAATWRFYSALGAEWIDEAEVPEPVPSVKMPMGLPDMWCKICGVNISVYYNADVIASQNSHIRMELVYQRYETLSQALNSLKSENLLKPDSEFYGEAGGMVFDPDGRRIWLAYDFHAALTRGIGRNKTDL